MAVNYGTHEHRFAETAWFGTAGMRVSWGDAIVQPSTTRHSRLFHGGNGTTPVDSGLPLTLWLPACGKSVGEGGSSWPEGATLSGVNPVTIW